MSRGRPGRSAEVVMTAAAFLMVDGTFWELAEFLGMNPQPEGAIDKALRRTGNPDVLRALRRGRRYTDPARRREVLTDLLARMTTVEIASARDLATERRPDLAPTPYPKASTGQFTPEAAA